MEARFTNGATVNRIWSDGKSTELIAAFQYENDAISFAEARAAEDRENDFGPCSYAIHCTYSGKLTMVSTAAIAKSKAA